MKVLAKEHGVLVCDNSGTPAAPVWALGSGSNGYRDLSSGGTGFFVSDTYFDLAGMTLREKTLFFEGATVQEVLAPVVFNGQPGDSLIIVDLMCSKPLTDTELIFFPVFGNFAGTNTALTFDQTIYAQICQYVIDLDTAQWGSMVKMSSNQIGSMSATASDRIYSYRIVTTAIPFSGTRFTITPARHVLSADVKKEEEFQYVMRLRRSYELAQGQDVD
tara:strand:- start:1058 stop:1711 length:654 start_codon:yes stop_codon:yes gene_type:complete